MGLVSHRDDDKAPGPSTLLGVTHCPKPEHAGAEGCLTLVCKQCDATLCRACGDELLGAVHLMSTVDLVAKEKASAISAALPELRQGVTHQVAQAAQARSLLETLALNRSVVLEALAAATARLHADVDVRHAAMVREIDAAYGAQVAGLQRELSAGCAAGNDDRDGRGSADGMLYQHHRQLDVCREAVDSDWGSLVFEAECVEEGADGVVALGRLRSCLAVPTVVSDVCCLHDIVPP